jgi:hypothetical protein
MISLDIAISALLIKRNLGCLQSCIFLSILAASKNLAGFSPLSIIFNDILIHGSRKNYGKVGVMKS